jgi:hypothetical protein
MNYKNLERTFEALHNMSPKSFNPDYNPKVKSLWDKALEMNEELEPFRNREDRSRSLMTIYQMLLKKKGK